MARPSHRPLAGQTVVITGAGSGIGRALAQRFSGHGCPVAMVDANREALEETGASLGGSVLAQSLDVRDRLDQFAFAARVREWTPAPIGAVFNNAGVAVSSTVAAAAIEDDEWLHAINFEGVVHGVRAFLPILLEQGSGAIVNTSSVFGLAGIPYQSAYCASKFAVRGFTESSWRRRRPSAIRSGTSWREPECEQSLSIPVASRQTSPATAVYTPTRGASAARGNRWLTSSRRWYAPRPSGPLRSSIRA